MIPEGEWSWLGRAGHYLLARRCRFHLHTHVGQFCISTVGDQHSQDAPDSPAEQIGSGYLYETAVFDLSRGEEAWNQAVTVTPYNSADEAERGHVEVCREFARCQDVAKG